MNVTKTWRPNLISDPDVAVVNIGKAVPDSPSDVIEDAKKLALETMNVSMSSYHGYGWRIATNMQDEYEITLSFHKD